MSAPIVIPVSPAGMFAAVACVAAGGPLFTDGLRALRVRRLLASLAASAPEPGHHGFVRFAGEVALESPLFSPLSQRPCAAYELEVHALDGSACGRVRQARAFKLVAGGVEALVQAADARWNMPVTAERDVAAGEQISANMAALLEGEATLRWLRDRRAPMRIVERSVAAGVHVEVFGQARPVESVELAVAEAEQVLAATGTDGVVVTAGPEPRGAAARPQVEVVAAEPLDVFVHAAGGDAARALAPEPWRAWGAVGGPLLSFAGLLYLAHAIDASIAGRP